MSSYRAHRVDRQTVALYAFIPFSSLFLVLSALQTCPFLIRVFIKENASFEKTEFVDFSRTPEKEFQIYTWMDATLRELTDMLKEVNEIARQRDTTLHFQSVYPTRSGELKLAELGTVNSTRSGPEDRLSLDVMKHSIGDFLAVEIKSYQSQNPPRSSYGGERTQESTVSHSN